MTRSNGDRDDETPSSRVRFPNPIEEIAGLRGYSAAERVARGLVESPAYDTARKMIEAPWARLALEATNSPARLTATQLALGIAADTRINEAIRKITEPRSGLAPRLTAMQPIAIDQAKLAALGAITPSFNTSVAEALKGIRPFPIDSAFGRAVQDSRRALEESMKPWGGAGSVVKHFEEQHKALRESLVASLAGPMGDIAKAGQWASIIRNINTPDIGSTLGKSLGEAVVAMRASIGQTFSATIAADQMKMSAALGLTTRLGNELASTRLKMSMLAGIGEVADPRSSLHLDAYRSLFGEWRSRPDLPENFWRDPRVRKRMYREAEVDGGLIEARPGLALEVMIESGLTAGMRSDTNAVAVITLGDVSMTVRSRGTRHDAYAALERFEQELRAYINRKLEGCFGPDWFKGRASNLIGKAKGTRKAAMERGEKWAPLINFLELGELSGLVQNGKNWDEVFSDVFINRSEFDHDMQKLIATRRPTMHMRPIDGVRLVELLCVMQRLSQQMLDDGAWKDATELDL